MGPRKSIRIGTADLPVIRFTMLALNAIV